MLVKLQEVLRLYHFVLRVIAKQLAEYMSANMPRHQNQSMNMLSPSHWVRKDTRRGWLARRHGRRWAGGSSKEALLIKWLFLFSTECCQIEGEMRERFTGATEILSENQVRTAAGPESPLANSLQ